MELHRRDLLVGGTLGVLVPASVEASPDKLISTFMSVSRVLVGSAWLDVRLGQHLFDAFAKADANFPSELAALQASLTAKTPAPPLSKAILRAWYVGVVGLGAGAVCVTYGSALMNQTVSDVLKPPSYAYGPYGSWTTQPISKASA
jgi:hypothetical protein